METFNIHEAKTHLSRRVEKAARGEPFVIAEAGKPMVRVVPSVEVEPVVRSRMGSLAGLIDVPDDFDEMGREEIERMFCGEADG